MSDNQFKGWTEAVFVYDPAMGKRWNLGSGRSERRQVKIV
jgi:hypothetical protein